MNLILTMKNKTLRWQNMSNVMNLKILLEKEMALWSPEAENID